MNTSKDSKDNTRRSIGMDEVCVFPRRKMGDGQSAKRIGFRMPLTLRLEQLELVYCKLQFMAVKELGVSLTTLKEVCRSLGVDQWPFRRWSACWRWLSNEFPPVFALPHFLHVVALPLFLQLSTLTTILDFTGPSGVNCSCLCWNRTVYDGRAIKNSVNE